MIDRAASVVILDSVVELCIKCDEIKPLSDFPLGRTCCRECTNMRNLLRKMERGQGVHRNSTLCVLKGNQWCTSCNSAVPVENFYPINKSTCKECIRVQGIESRATLRSRIPVIAEHKTCPKCEREKPSAEFLRDMTSADFLGDWCKECLGKGRAERRRVNPSYRIAEQRRAKLKRKTPDGALNNRVKASIGRHIKDGSASQWEGVLGYTIADLRKHIISLFTGEMKEADLDSGKIHIDHIIPASFFYYESTSDPDFKPCWALSNLQPLWSGENQSKNDKMPDGSRARDHRKLKKAAYQLAKLERMAAVEAAESAA